jgi:hypothetical protein
MLSEMEQSCLIQNELQNEKIKIYNQMIMHDTLKEKSSRGCDSRVSDSV